MKAVVLELRSGKAAVLGNDGTVFLIPDANYKVGDVIENVSPVSEESNRFSKIINKAGAFAIRHQAVAAVVAIALILTGTGLAAFNTPCSRVSLDVNPSVEYRLNVFDRVISTAAFNDDGAKIIESEGSGLKGKKIDSAMQITLDALRDNGYIKKGADTEAVYTVDSVFSKNTSISQNVADAVVEWNKTQDPEISVSAVSVEVPKEIRKEAKEKKVSPGKLTLVKELENAAGTAAVNEEEWLSKPVTVIMKAIDTPQEEVPTVAAETEAPAPKNAPSSSSGKKKKKDKKKDDKKKTTVTDETQVASAETEKAEGSAAETAEAASQQGSSDGSSKASGNTSSGTGSDKQETASNPETPASSETPVPTVPGGTEQPAPTDPTMPPVIPEPVIENPEVPQPVNPELPTTPAIPETPSDPTTPGSGGEGGTQPQSKEEGTGGTQPQSKEEGTDGTQTQSKEETTGGTQPQSKEDGAGGTQIQSKEETTGGAQTQSKEENDLFFENSDQTSDQDVQ